MIHVFIYLFCFVYVFFYSRIFRNLVDDSFENDFLPLLPETLVNDSCDSYNLKLSLPNNLDEENNKLVKFLLKLCKWLNYICLL